jgi:hypothetical protein
MPRVVLSHTRCALPRVARAAALLVSAAWAPHAGAVAGPARWSGAGAPVVAGALAPVRTALFDPKDGPDIDLTWLIEDGEVRLQVLANLAFLDAECPIERDDPARLVGPDIELAREALFTHFTERSTVSIDGVVVSALDAGFDVDPGEVSLLPHFPRFGARAIFKTRSTLVYPCKAPPRRVEVVWRAFPPDLTTAAGSAGVAAPPFEVVCRIVGGGLNELARFSPREPAHTWHRPAEGSSHLAPVPALAAAPRARFPFALAGATGVVLLLTFAGPRRARPLTGPLAVALTALLTLRATEGTQVELPDAAEARAVFEPLHTNIYRAFDYTRDEDVYDALAESVDGALLARLYDEVYRSLVIQEEGGAVSRVERVRYVATDVREVGVRAVETDDRGAASADRRAAFVVDTRWQVDGAVYHWGHAHHRTNEYRAEYTVAATERGWRIVASHMLEQRRIDSAPLAEQGF